ncbi:MAG TPA: hypothetical protein VHQ66_09880, partial [Myxococcota bacterium]|nr:hypothetical protein [Myxococcota bacterium]
WWNRWTLLDLFFALVAAVAFGRLYGPAAFGVAALALALTYTEPGAPRVAWLAVLAAEALSRAVPAGRFARALRLVRAAALAWLVVVAVPFAVSALRAGLYPALVPPAGGPIPFEAASREADDAVAQAQEARAGKVAEAQRLAVDEDAMERRRSLGYAEAPEALPAPAPGTLEPALPHADPAARITTGPGLPTWTWERVNLTWSGPVEKDRQLRLMLLPPPVNALLAMARVVLVGALIAVVAADLWRRRRAPPPPFPAAPETPRSGASDGPAPPPVAPTVLGLALALALPAPLVSAPAGAQLPTPEILEELRDRLLDTEPCQPSCVAIPRMRLEARGQTLRLELAVEAAADAALPLPGSATSWLPAEVRVGAEPARALRREADGTLWLRVGPGVATVTAAGPLPPNGSVALPLPLLPHRTEAELEGFELFGLRPDGGVEPTLQLVRLEPAPEDEAPPPAALPPFVRVDRTLSLGLTWAAHVQIRRLSPADEALVLDVPLLPGESITTPGLEVRDGRARVSLAPGAASAGWTSVLAVANALELVAPEGVPWTESWSVRASPIWHHAPDGIPPVQADPTRPGPDFAWRPWPGERVRLAIERPAGIGGATRTLDASRLVVRPGARSTDAELALTLRSSQGGEQRVTLPEGAELQRVAIDSAELPIRQEGRAVVLP